jgi:hypothetical protein
LILITLIDQQQALLDAAFLQAAVDLTGDVDEGAPGGHLEPQLLALSFHLKLLVVREKGFSPVVFSRVGPGVPPFL